MDSAAANARSYNGTVTVGACRDHNYSADWKDLGDGTHGQRCTTCGGLGNLEEHRFEDGSCRVCGAKYCVELTIDGETVPYTTLHGAWNAAQGHTAGIHILEPLTEQEACKQTDPNSAVTLTMASGAGVVFSLNEQAAENAFSVENGSLILENGAYASDGVLLQVSGGDVTVKDCTLTGDSAGAVICVDGGGTLHITGHTALSTTGLYGITAGHGTVHIAAGSDVTITGSAEGYVGMDLERSSVCDIRGKVTITAAQDVQSCCGIFGESSEITVHPGAEVTAAAARTTGDCIGIYVVNNSKFTVHPGAQVTAAADSADGEGYGLLVNGSKVSLSGGTFTGSTAAAQEENGEGAVGDFLASGYYYYDGSGQRIKNVTGSKLEGTVHVQPNDLTIAPGSRVTTLYGEPVTLTVHAEPGQAFRYQWYNDDDEPIQGAVSNTYEVSADAEDVGGANERYFYCRMINTSDPDDIRDSEMIRVLVAKRPVTASVSGSKTYDGTAAAPNAAIELDGVLETDRTGVTAAGTCTYASKDAGENVPMRAENVALQGEEALLNCYELTGSTVDGTGTIEHAPLTIAAVGLQPKTYDGTTEAEVLKVEFSGCAEGESLTPDEDFTVSAAFADANAGERKRADVTVTLKDSGTAKNYVLSGGAFSVEAEIQKADTAMRLTATPDAVRGGGTVTLTVEGLPEGETASLSCADGGIRPDPAGGNTWTAELPAGDKEYTFTARYPGSGNYNPAEPVTCTVRAVAEKLDPDLALSAEPATLTGGGTVTLTLEGLPAGERAEVTCTASDGTVIAVVPGADSHTFTADLPDRTETYTFTARFAGSGAYNPKEAYCVVPVTRQDEPPVEPEVLTLSAQPETLTGGGTVTLTAAGVPAGAEAVLTCTGSGVTVTQTGPNTWNAVFPNETADYTFTVEAGGKTAACTVPVTKQAEPEKPNKPNKPVIDDVFPPDHRPSEPEKPAERTSGASGAASKRITQTPQTTAPVRPAEPVQPEQPAQTGHSEYTDVPSTEWYYQAVNLVVQKGLMSGTGSRFEPGTLLSRAMLAQILYQHAGKPTAAAVSRFADVPEGEWFTDAVNWAAGERITSGYSSGLFGTNDPITREQLAVMLWRYAGTPEPVSHTLAFADAASASDYAVDALCWAVENGILSGKSGNRLDPGGFAARAEAAQMISRFIALSDED